MFAGSVENQYLARCLFALRPLDQQPLLWWTSQRASSLDALHERARGQGAQDYGLPWLPVM